MEEFNYAYKNLDFFSKNFTSYSTLSQELDEWCKINHVPIKIRTSNRIKDVNDQAKRLVYSVIYYTCVHYGTHRRRVTTGTRTNQKVYATNCPFMIHFKSDQSKGEFYVFKYELEHNHAIGPEIFSNYPKYRRNEDTEPDERASKRKLSFSQPELGKLIKQEHSIDTLIDKIRTENSTVITMFDSTNNLTCLYIQLKFQSEWFRAYSNIVYVSTKCKFYCRNYYLYIVMVHDHVNELRPVCYCFMRYESLEFLFKSLTQINSCENVKFVVIDEPSVEALVDRYVPKSVCVVAESSLVSSVCGFIDDNLRLDDTVKSDLMTFVRGMMNAVDDNEYKCNYNLMRKIKNISAFFDYFDTKWNSCKHLWTRMHRQHLLLVDMGSLSFSLKPNAYINECVMDLIECTKRMYDAESKSVCVVDKFAQQSHQYNQDSEQMLKCKSNQQKFEIIKNLCQDITSLMCDSNDVDFCYQQGQLESLVRSLRMQKLHKDLSNFISTSLNQSNNQ